MKKKKIKILKLEVEIGYFKVEIASDFDGSAFSFLKIQSDFRNRIDLCRHPVKMYIGLKPEVSS